MIKIYKLEDLSNGKIYIGQTSKTIEERLSKHIYSRNEECTAHDLPLRKALRDNPTLSNWGIEQLHVCDDYDEASMLEKAEIVKFDSTNKEIGYNVAVGGIGGDTLSNHPNLENIKEKLSQSKMGANNPNAKSLILSSDLGERYEFGSAEDCKRFLDLNNTPVASSTIKRKCNGVIKDNSVGYCFTVDWNKV